MSNAKFKHSGVEWLGEIPKHWEVVPLRAIFQSRNEDNKNLKYTQILSLVKDVGVIPYEDKGDKGNKAKDDLSGYKIAKKNDFILNKMNAVIGSLGVSKYDGLVSPIYLVLYIFNPKSLLNFYAYLFESKKFQKSLKKVSYGIMDIRESIDYLDFKNIKIPLPPLDEQRQIAEFLDSKCEKIAEFINKKQKLIALLKEQKIALINECVCGRYSHSLARSDSKSPCEVESLKSPLPCGGGLGVGKDSPHNAKSAQDSMILYPPPVSPSAREGESDSSLRASEASAAIHTTCHTDTPLCHTELSQKVKYDKDNDTTQTFKFKHSGVEWLGEIPKHWEAWRLRDIFEIKNGYTPSKANQEFWENGTLPWFRMDDIHTNGRILNDSLQHITPKAVEPNGLFPAYSLIIATTATIGEHALITVDSLANQRFTFLIKKVNCKVELDMKFVFYYGYVLGAWCKSNVNVSNFPAVDMDRFRVFKIPLPPLAEQKQIAEFLDSKCEKIDKAIALIQREIESIKEYKTSLIDNAVQGKINV